MLRFLLDPAVKRQSTMVAQLVWAAIVINDELSIVKLFDTDSRQLTPNSQVVPEIYAYTWTFYCVDNDKF